MEWRAASLQSYVFIFLPPANEVCEGYVFTGACLSTGGGGVRGGGVGVRGRGMCVAVGRGAWQERWPLQWAVRILLECILVSIVLFLFLHLPFIRTFDELDETN